MPDPASLAYDRGSEFVENAAEILVWDLSRLTFYPDPGTGGGRQI
jgi:hypothetical protein